MFTVLEYIISFAFVVVLSIIMMFFTYRQIEFLFLWMIIISSFFVYAGLLPFWIIVLFIFFEIVILAVSFYKNRIGGG